VAVLCGKKKRFKLYKHYIKEKLCKEWEKGMAMAAWMRNRVKLKSGVLPQIQKRPERKKDDKNVNMNRRVKLYFYGLRKEERKAQQQLDLCCKKKALVFHMELREE
jgi:hypothetical protein